MTSFSARAYTRYVREALVLLGNLIRKARIERKETLAELAARAGISRGLLQRIERGDRGCSVGAVFQVTAMVGIQLFELDADGLWEKNRTVKEILILLPKSARVSRKPVKDDF